MHKLPAGLKKQRSQHAGIGRIASSEVIKEVQIPYWMEVSMARKWAFLWFFEHLRDKNNPDNLERYSHGNDLRSDYAALARSLLKCQSFANERIKGARPG
jgi:hypothetical protein